jgi:hypothetical protein
MQRKQGTQDKAMSSDNAAEARAAVAEATAANMAAKLIEVAGPQALKEAVMPSSALVRVQFLRSYSFGGLPGPRKGSFTAAPFSAREGDIFDMPQDLLERLSYAHEAKPLFERDESKWQPMKILRALLFNPDTGKRDRQDITTLTVDDLVKKCKPVGLPKSPQA